jgi:hypothetical protein
MSGSKPEGEMIIGYARVSTDGQTLDAQLSALKAAGADRVFSEKVGGAVTDRKALAKAMAALGSGDDPPPLKWSDLRYVFDIQEDCNGKEAIQA